MSEITQKDLQRLIIEEAERIIQENRNVILARAKKRLEAQQNETQKAQK